MRCVSVCDKQVPIDEEVGQKDMWHLLVLVTMETGAGGGGGGGRVGAGPASVAVMVRTVGVAPGKPGRVTVRMV